MYRFQTWHGMNSFNHYAYGAVGEWMYRYMTGIEPDEANAGFHHFILKPRPDQRTYLPSGQSLITSASTTYQSRYGTIASAWSAPSEENLIYECIVPANSTATLYFPAESREVAVYESGVLATIAEGVTYVGYEDGCQVYKLGSGVYRFTTDDADKLQSASVNVSEADAVYDLSGRKINAECSSHNPQIVIKGRSDGKANKILVK